MNHNNAICSYSYLVQMNLFMTVDCALDSTLPCLTNHINTLLTLQLILIIECNITWSCAYQYTVDVKWWPVSCHYLFFHFFLTKIKMLFTVFNTSSSGCVIFIAFSEIPNFIWFLINNAPSMMCLVLSFFRLQTHDC